MICCLFLPVDRALVCLSVPVSKGLKASVVMAVSTQAVWRLRGEVKWTCKTLSLIGPWG